MIYAFFNLGFGEIFIIFVLVLMLFGADKIPEFARSLGKGIRAVKDATEGVKRDIQSSVDDVKADIDKNVANVQKELEPVESLQRQAKNAAIDISQFTKKNVDDAEKSFKSSAKDSSEA